MLIITNMVTLAIASAMVIAAAQIAFKVLGGKGWWWNGVVNERKVNKELMMKEQL